ncbi:MAG TPA: gamma-glutamyl-gamma-aminobutyrate hydrolase family protein [Gemmatimonadaceae bacterium]|nr:gamma-glutamyl-gamma-aminobutyrate hydrolase family protein [Gemmatimonadaceae bacterium]
MHNAPIVGIPTQTFQSLGGASGNIPASWAMSQRYVHALTTAGAVPWLIPLVDDATLRRIYEELDGVFLPGGADIDPTSYGRDTHPLCDKTDRERDRVELALANWALSDGKPVLGVCRGLQLLNVAAGGSLYEDLGQQMPGAIKHDYFPFGENSHPRDYLAHEVRIAPSSRLARLLGTETARVNSMHHQGIRELGEGLSVTARAPDGLIEGIEGAEGRGGYVVAVQWHPEALTTRDEASQRLFTDFVEVAGEYRAQRLTGVGGQ